MSTPTNKGDQRISWYYQLPLSSSLLNERFYGILPAGIFSGLTLSIASSGSVGISPGVVEIKDDRNKMQIKSQVLSDFTFLLPGSSDNIGHITYNTSGDYIASSLKIVVDEMGNNRAQLATQGSSYNNWTLTTAGNYTYDSDKIVISGGSAKLFGNINCLQFDGTNAEKISPMVPIIPAKSRISITAWIRVADFSSDNRIYENYYGAGDRPLMFVTHGIPPKLSVIVNDGSWHQGATTLSADVWYFVAFTYDKDAGAPQGHLYLDGAVDDSFSKSSALHTSTDIDLMGRGFDGRIDEVALWDKKLSTAEILELYNSGKPSDLSNSSAWSDCILWWKMGDGDTYPTILDHKASYDATMLNMETEDIVTATGLTTVATDDPTVITNNGWAYTTFLTSFIDTITGTTGTGIKYQLSTDDGSSWVWMSGGSWVAITSGQTNSWYYANESNVASAISANILVLPSPGTLKVKAFLHSDEADIPELDNIYVSANYTYSTDDDLYVDTTTASQYQPPNMEFWSDIILTYNIPVNGDIRLMFSNNNKSTWLSFLSGSWQVPLSANKRDYGTTIADAQTYFSTLPPGSGTLDVRLFVYTSAAGTTPYVDNIRVSSTVPNNSYIHAYWAYSEEKEWYVDWVTLLSAQGTSASPVSNYVCLGRVLFNPSGGITGIDYSARQEARFPSTSADADFVEQVEDIIADMLSAGPNIQLTYDDPNRKIEISATNVPGSGDHSTMLELLDDDHEQYIHGLGRTLLADWFAGPVTISATAISMQYLSAVNLNIGAGSFQEAVDDQTAVLLSAGPNIIITYDDAAGRLTINNPQPSFGIMSYAAGAAHRGKDDIYELTTSFDMIVDFNAEGFGGNYWTIKQNASNPRRSTASFAVEGYGYVFGGSATSGFSSENGRYNDTMDSWSVLNNLPTVRCFPGTFVISEVAYVFGGASVGSLDTMLRYSPNSDNWTLLASTLNNTVSGNRGFTIEDLGYSVGGNYTSATERYDAALDTWTVVASMNTLRGSHACFGIGRYGIAAAGLSAAGAVLSTVERYDPGLDVWSFVSTELTAAEGPGSFASVGLGYVGNGLSGGSFNNYFKQYEIEKDFWSTRVNAGPSKAYAAGFGLNEFGYFSLGATAAGAATPAHRQYRNVSMCTIPHIFTTRSVQSSSVKVGTNLNRTKTMNLPVWINTDGTTATSAWHYMRSNSQSLIKTGQSINILSATTAGVYSYRIRVGIPRDILSGTEIYKSIQSYPTSALGKVSWQQNGICHITHGFFTWNPSAGDSTDAHYEYNEISNTWITKTAHPISAYRDRSFVINGIGHTCGGVEELTIPGTASGTSAVQLKSHYIYDDLSDTWTQKADMPGSAWGHGTFSLNGYGYAFQGLSAAVGAGTYPDINYKYNDSLNTWASKTVPLSSSYGPLAFSVDGFGYTAGGVDAAVIMKTCQQYDDLLDLWTAKDSMNVVRTYAFGFSVGSRGYAMGGLSAIGQPSPLATESYSRVSNLWNHRTSLPAGFNGDEGTGDGLGTDAFLVGSEQTTAYRMMTDLENQILTVTLNIEE